MIVEVEAPTRESNKETQKQVNQKVCEKDTTRLTSTTPLLVLHSKPMRNQGKSEVASPMKRLIRHVEGDPGAEGSTGCTKDGCRTNQSEKQPVETFVRETIG